MYCEMLQEDLEVLLEQRFHQPLTELLMHLRRHIT